MIDLPRVEVQPFFKCPPQPLLPADATPMPSDVISVASQKIPGRRNGGVSSVLLLVSRPVGFCWKPVQDCLIDLLAPYTSELAGSS